MSRSGFTLIELAMVILLVAVLAAVAIPTFQDFRDDARNAAVRGALGGVRSAIAISRAAIALRESTTVPQYPTAVEMQQNRFDTSHPILSGTAIMDASAGMPSNPWTTSTLPTSAFNTVLNCNSKAKGTINAPGQRGWCYDPSDGEFWANSSLNGALGGATENSY